MARWLHFFLILAAVTLNPTLTAARVARVVVDRRETILTDRTFGTAGPYEKIVGKISFSFDP